MTEAVNDCVEKTIRSQFAQYRWLASHLLSRSKQEIEKQRTVAYSRIMRLQKDEMDPFTIDDRFMKHVKSLRTELQESSESEELSENDRASAAGELCVALEGYFLIAASRFTDHACMLLVTELLNEAIQSLPPKLLGESLGDDDYQAMFAEDVNQTLRRSTLEATIKRLRTAARELASFSMASS